MRDANSMLLDLQVQAAERRRIVALLRNDETLWAYLCGAIAPGAATSGALRAALRLAADWIEEERA